MLGTLEEFIVPLLLSCSNYLNTSVTLLTSAHPIYQFICLENLDKYAMIKGYILYINA